MGEPGQGSSNGSSSGKNGNGAPSLDQDRGLDLKLLSTQQQPPMGNANADDPDVSPRARASIGRLGRHYKPFSKRHGTCIALFALALVLFENDGVG